MVDLSDFSFIPFPLSEAVIRDLNPFSCEETIGGWMERRVRIGMKGETKRGRKRRKETILLWFFCMAKKRGERGRKGRKLRYSRDLIFPPLYDVRKEKKRRKEGEKKWNYLFFQNKVTYSNSRDLMLWVFTKEKNRMERSWFSFKEKKERKNRGRNRKEKKKVEISFKWYYERNLESV